MTFNPALPATSQADMASALGSIRENLRAIARMEMPQTTKATAATVAIGATDYLVKFTGNTSVSTINITPETTTPDVIALWGYSTDGFKFVSGGNIDSSCTPTYVRPYEIFRIIYFQANTTIYIQSLRSGFEYYAESWMRRAWVQKNSSTGITNEGCATPTQTGTRTAVASNGFEMLQYYSNAGAGAGWYITNYSEVDLNHIVRFGASILMTALSGHSMWVGFHSANDDNNPTPSGTTLSIRYVNGTDTTFKLYERISGGAAVVTDTGFTPVAGATHLIEVASVGASSPLAVYIDGQLCISKTTLAFVGGTDKASFRCRSYANGSPVAFQFSTGWWESQ